MTSKRTYKNEVYDEFYENREVKDSKTIVKQFLYNIQGKNFNQDLDKTFNNSKNLSSKDEKSAKNKLSTDDNKNTIYHPQSACFNMPSFNIEREQNHSDFEAKSVSSSENNRKDKFKYKGDAKKYSSSSSSIKDNQNFDSYDAYIPKLDHLIEAYVIVY